MNHVTYFRIPYQRIWGITPLRFSLLAWILFVIHENGLTELGSIGKAPKIIELRPFETTFSPSKNFLKGLLSHEGNSLAMGLEYLERHPELNWSSYLIFFSGRDNSSTNPQRFSFGASVFLSMYETTTFSLEIAPTLYFAQVKLSSQNESTVGPGIRWILSFSITTKLKISSEVWYLGNWANSQLPPNDWLGTLGFNIEL